MCAVCELKFFLLFIIMYEYTFFFFHILADKAIFQVFSLLSNRKCERAYEMALVSCCFTCLIVIVVVAAVASHFLYIKCV